MYATEVEPFYVQDQHIRLTPDLYLFDRIYNFLAFFAGDTVAILHFHLLQLREGFDAGTYGHVCRAGSTT